MAGPIIETTDLTVYYGARRGIEAVNLTVHYFDSTATLFTEGVQTRDLIVLLTTGAVFFVLSLVCFVRRDVTTHAWPWRSRISAGRTNKVGPSLS